ncbi:MAG TPA: hypothetical protein VIY51_11550 [Xanthobacteraceae bacterium]
MSGGGGKDSYYWYTKGLGAVMINNPNYGKMAADSIAKEVAERKLAVPAATPPAGIVEDTAPIRES